MGAHLLPTTQPLYDVANHQNRARASRRGAPRQDASASVRVAADIEDSVIAVLLQTRVALETYSPNSFLVLAEKWCHRLDAPELLVDGCLVGVSGG